MQKETENMQKTAKAGLTLIDTKWLAFTRWNVSNRSCLERKTSPLRSVQKRQTEMDLLSNHSQRIREVLLEEINDRLVRR